MGASGVNGSSRVGGHGTEDAGEDNSNNETYNPRLKAVRPRLRSADPAGEGRSSSVEHLVRPALPGRKAHKKTCIKENRGTWREGNQDRDEERQNVEHVGGRQKGKQKQRPTERSETHGDGAQYRQGRGSTESSSSCNSDIQLNSTLEDGEGPDLQRGQTCLRPHSIGCTQTITANSQSPCPAMRSKSSASPQTPIQTRSSSLSRLSSRAAAGDMHSYSFSSSREPDPFWVEVRTGAAIGRSSQSHHTQSHIPSLTSSELGAEVQEEEVEEEEEEEEEVEDGEEGGSGVTEVMSQTVTSAAALPCVPFGERRMSKREKNRIKCLRRRQRRRERWRQSQLQESRQVNDTINWLNTKVKNILPILFFSSSKFQINSFINRQRNVIWGSNLGVIIY